MLVITEESKKPHGECMQQIQSPTSPAPVIVRKRALIYFLTQSYVFVLMIGVTVSKHHSESGPDDRGFQMAAATNRGRAPRCWGQHLGCELAMHTELVLPHLFSTGADALHELSQGSTKVWHRQMDFCVIPPACEIYFEWRFYFYFFQFQSQKVNPILTRWTSQGLQCSRDSYDGIWTAEPFSFAVKCNKKICKKRRLKLCAEDSEWLCSVRATDGPAPLVESGLTPPDSCSKPARVGKGEELSLGC